MEKIGRRAEEFGLTSDEIIKDIESCKTAVIPFCKNPNKQNFYEKIAADMIKDMYGVDGFEKLPNQSLYVSDGVVFKNKEHKKYPKAKTLDFKFRYKNYTIYASHKYTKDSGGSQDNQYKDLQDFIIQSRDTKIPQTVFIAIADGDYYSNQNGKAGTTKMEHLKSLCTKKTGACRMEGLIDCLNSLCD